MRPHWSTLVDPLAKVEVVTVGNARGNTHALVDTPAEKLAEVKAVGDNRDDARALVDTLADTLAQVRAVTLGVHEAIRRHWSNLLLTR